jgi:N-acetylmuramoyl-L-alanine amidase
MTCRLLLLAALLASTALGLVGCAGTLGAGSFGTVVIDAGHGGHDQGGRAIRGANEKDLVLDMAKRLKKALEWKGFRVVMTRSTDVFIPLDNRVAISNRTYNSIFVSVHVNWDRRRSGHGVETFYCSPRSYRLAANVQRQLAGAYRTSNRGVKRGCWIRVLRKNSRPAILVETGFDSNPGDNAVLQSASGRQRIADAIAKGIIAERQGRRP